MTNVDSVNDDALATRGAVEIAAADPRCLCRHGDPSPVCEVHANRLLALLTRGVEPSGEPDETRWPFTEKW